MMSITKYRGWKKALSLLIAFTFLVQNSALSTTKDILTAKKDNRAGVTRTKSSLTDISDINIPQDIGLVKESFQGDGGKLIVHIQDAHCNFEAQTNISKILEILMDDRGLTLVALEGSAGEIDTSLFTTFPDVDIRREVATYFMKKGKISGAEHLAINTKKPILLYGIENKDYYLANLKAFTGTLSSRTRAKKVCEEINTYLIKLKRYIYNKELQAFDKKVTDYNNDKIKFVTFCAYLNKAAAREKVDLKNSENFSHLVNALKIEKKIDFKKVDKERSAIINALEKKLSQDELSDLLMKSLSYRTKKIKASDYYTYLKDLAAKAKVKLSKFKNFNSYVNYITVYGKINNVALFKELKLLEGNITETLYTNNDQRELNKLLTNIRLMEDLINISLSKDDAGYFTEHKGEFNSAEFTNFIQRQASRYALAYSSNPNIEIIDELMPTLQKFYEIADKREDALLENTLNKMNEKNFKVSALISGGYHTEGLTRRFRERGISYIVVAPRITDLDAETPYLEVLTGGKSTFDEFLSTEESPLSTTSLNALDPAASPEQVTAYVRESALLFLSGYIYGLKQKNPRISDVELQAAVELAKQEWLKRYNGPHSDLCQTAVSNINFNLDAIRMDARGAYYIPVSVSSIQGGQQVTEERVIRYYNLALRPTGESFTPEHEGEQESIGMQVLTSQQYAMATEAAKTSAMEMPEEPIEEVALDEELQAFTQRFTRWVESPAGQNTTLPERINRLAQIFVESMHGLRGSPDSWLLAMVQALNPGNAAVHQTAREERQRIRRRLAAACGPRALFDALYNPKEASPLFRERYASPAHISLDLSSLLLTAIDMTELDGRVADIDDEGRLHHTAFALSQLGDLIGLAVEPNVNSIVLLTSLTNNGQRCIAHVRRETGDPEGNHYIEVESVGPSTVTYRDNGAQRQEPIDSFMARWTGNILVRSQLQDELTNLIPQMEAQGIRYRFLEANELKQIKGACGVIGTRGAGFAEELTSLRLMEYRGRDDVGISFVDEFGARVVKVQGYSEGLARALYMDGEGLPERAMAFLDLPAEGEDDALREALRRLREASELRDEDRKALHAKWRNLSNQERQQIRHRLRLARKKYRERQKIDEKTTHFTMDQMYPKQLDGSGHTKKDRAMDLGRISMPAHDLFGGKRYYINGTNIPDVVNSIKKNHKLDVEYTKYFIKFELEEGIAANQEALAQTKLTEEQVIKAYDRLVDRVIRSEALSEADGERWEQVMVFLKDRQIQVPSVFTQDPVQYLFRIQSSLIGTLGVNQGWQREIEEMYRQNLKDAGVEGWGNANWLQDWRQEATLNIAGRAFQTLTMWFQQKYVRPIDDDKPENYVIDKFGIERGTVDCITLQYMAWLDFVGGHDRWATTGSTEKKDGQPHTDTGAISGLGVGTIDEFVIKSGRPDESREPAQRMLEYLRRSKDDVPGVRRGKPSRFIAHNGDLDPNVVPSVRNMLIAMGYDFTTDDNKTVLTDTKTLIVFWEYVRDAIYLDGKEGRVSEDNRMYTDPNDKNNFLQGKIKTPEGQEITWAELWNKIIETGKRKGEDISPDEAALRIALAVFGPESEIAADTYSAHMPDKHICVSHNRPLYIVIHEDGRYQVTSDTSSALRLWDPAQVDADIKKLNEIESEGRKKERAAKQERDHKIEQLQAEQPDDLGQQVIDAGIAFDTQVKAITEEVEARKNEIRKKYKARVVTLKGKQKVASIQRGTNDNGDPEVQIDFTDFMGNPIDPAATDEIKDAEDEIQIDIADKGTFRTYAEKHIDEIPWVVRKSVAERIRPDGTVDMSLVTNAEGEVTDGVDIERLKAKYGENLEGLKRIFVTGIGSSERDAKCIERLFKTLLPGVEIIPVGPGKLVSENQNYNADEDLIVGISWSGSTALTLDALAGANSKGVEVLSLTGRVKSDIGTLTADSMGRVEVKTGMEVAVFTTKGFLGILVDLGILGAQLSQLRDGAFGPDQPKLTTERLEQVQAERKEIIQTQKELPDILSEVINEDPRLDLEKEDSWVNQEGERYRHGPGALVIGSKHNNPIIEEGELKLEETRWILGKAYDYDDDTMWPLIDQVVEMQKKHPQVKWPIVISATDMDRIDKAMAIIRKCAELGLHFTVQTTEKDNPHFEEIEQICEKSAKSDDGRTKAQLYTVPKVHPALQSVIDAPFFFKYSVALSRAAGLSDLEIDSSRNLAKSVTVRGIEVPGKLYEMFQYIADTEGLDVGDLVEEHKTMIAEYWQSLATSVDKAIARLPVVYDHVTERCLPFERQRMIGRYSRFNHDKVEEAGGMDRVKKIVVITEEIVDVGVAAAMAAGPLGYSERQMTGKSIFDQPIDPTGKKSETKVIGNMPINGNYYTVTYNFRLHTFTITRDGDETEDGRLVIAGAPEIVERTIKGKKREIHMAKVDEEQFTEGDFAEEVKNFFGREYSVTADAVNGLVFDAAMPTLAGVNVVVHNVDDYDLLDDIDENTLVVPMRRSNHSPSGKDAEIADIADASDGRTGEQMAAPDDSLGEDKMLEVLESLPEGTPVFSITDENSTGVAGRGDNSFGSIALPNDLDATSAMGMYYMALMSLGVYIGDAKGVPNMSDQERGLISAAELARQVVVNQDQIQKIKDFLVSLRQNTANQGYMTMQIIGGGQDFSSALAWATILQRLCPGVTAEGLPVDESVHGPLAAVCYFIQKFLNQTTKEGVNPEFTPHPTEAPGSKIQDTLVFLLATDSRTLKATIVDAQRNATRNARFVLVVKESDKDKAEVEQLVKEGALVLTIPDSPNELTNVSQMTLATIVANEMNRSRSDEFSFERVGPGSAFAADVRAKGLPPTYGDEELFQLKARLRIVEETDNYYRTQEGGIITKDVDLRHINSTAAIKNGCTISGPSTTIARDVVIEENSYVKNSIIARGAHIQKNTYVNNSRIGGHAMIERSFIDGASVHSSKNRRTSVVESVLRTVDKKDSWEFGEGSEYRVQNERTVVGIGSSIRGQSELINTSVGEESIIDDCSVKHSEIGSHNFVKRTKMKLTHTESFVEIRGTPTEVAESWIGMGMEIRNIAYIEGVFPNKVLAMDIDDNGKLVTEVVDGIPNTSSVGNYVIFSGYSGEVGDVPQGGVVKRVTGEESSEHGTPIIKPGSVIAPETRLVGLAAHPDLSGPEHIVDEQNLTHIMPYSVVGFGGQEAWGQMMPGESRKGLSPRASTLGWTFTYSPDIVIRQTSLMKQKIRDIAIREGLPAKQIEDEVKKLDDFPNKMLKTARALCINTRGKLQEQLPTAENTDREKLEERIAALTAAINLYERHLESHAWDFEDGQFVNPWNHDIATKMYTNPKIDLAELSGDPATYKQRSMADILGASRRTGYEASLPEVTKPDTLRTRTDITIDNNGPIIESTVVVHPTATVLPGVVLKGNTKVGPGAVVWRGVFTDAEIGANTIALNCIAERTKVGKGTSLTSVRMGSTEVGDNVSATRAVLESTKILDNTQILPFAIVRGFQGEGVGGVIGCPFIDSEFTQGGVSQHDSTEVYNVRAPLIKVEIDGQEETFENVPNIAAGSKVGTIGGKIVAIESAFFASNTRIGEGAEIGFCAYVKNRVGPGERVLAFSLKSGRGAKKEVIGGILDMPGVVIRHLISKTKRAMRKAGYPEEKIKLVDKLVEAKIRKTLAEVEAMLLIKRAGDPEADEIPYEIAQLEEGIGRFQRHLNERRWEMADDTFVRGQWRRLSPEGAGRVRYAWEPEGQAPAPLSRGGISIAQVEEALEQGGSRLGVAIAEGADRHRDTEIPTAITGFISHLDSIAARAGVAPNMRDNAQCVRRLLDPEITEVLAKDDVANVDAFKNAAEQASGRVTRVPNARGGFVISANLILRDIGWRQVLERLFTAHRTADGKQPRFEVVVDAENEKDAKAIEALHLPGVTVSQAGEDETHQGRMERIRRAVRGMRGKRVRYRNICMIEKPQANAAEAAQQLADDINIDINIAVPESVSNSQIISAHKVFHDALEAIARDDRRIISILPVIETVSDDLQRMNEDFREAIEFLKNA